MHTKQEVNYITKGDINRAFNELASFLYAEYIEEKQIEVISNEITNKLNGEIEYEQEPAK